jgi:dipeptidyl aminopeptidase/acylaminoacyl peptidase
MKKSFLLAIAMLAMGSAARAEVETVEDGNLIYENIPPITGELTAQLQQYQNTRGAFFRDWSAKGGLIISTRFGEVSQLHRVSFPLGARSQITFYDEPLGGTTAAPGKNSQGFVFTRDSGGDENFHLYYFDEFAGSVTALTSGEGRNENPVWSKDGKQIAFRSNKRDGTNWDIYVTSPDSAGEARRVFEGNSQWWIPVEFSPDGSKLLLVKYISVVDTELYIVDLATGEASIIRENGAKAAYFPIDFTRDGAGIFLTSDAGSEFQTLRLYDIESATFSHLTADIPWNVGSADISADGRKIVFAVNANGRSELHIRSTRTNRELPVPDLPPGVVINPKFSPDSKRVAFTFNQATSPFDVFVYDLKSRKLVQWTASEVGGLDTSKFISPELVTFQSFDDLSISAYVYKPRGDGPHPVIISIHGGPEGQSRPYYSSTYQFWLAELGVAVVVPNVRGSTGFGKTFTGLDNGYKREDSVKDIGALLNWIATQDDLDAEKIVVYGGSYGGYMVLAAMTHYNERLMGAIDIVGISNFVTFLENTAPYRQDVRRPEYGDERIPEMRAFLNRISPLNNATRITKPLFIIQGLNDPRVPASEADQMKRIVRGNGGEVWYLAAKDEGHGFRKKKNRDFQAAAQTLFLEKLFAGE